MAIRVLASLPLRRSRIHFKYLFTNPILDHRISERFGFNGHRKIHSGRFLCFSDETVKPTGDSKSTAKFDSGGDKEAKVRNKKPKGKRATVKKPTYGSKNVKPSRPKEKEAMRRWLKEMRRRKKIAFKRMTDDEKVLFKLRKAQRKEQRIIKRIEKIDPAEKQKAQSRAVVHDPEILTPEEHHYFFMLGLKHKNYVPIGARGVYGGVILNMHLHWKKHETLQVIVKTFPEEEVIDIARELARLSGGIVLQIHEKKTIIMYRGRNYLQPPTEIMSPSETLSRKEAFEKSEFLEALRSVRQFIPKLKKRLQELQELKRNDPTSVCYEEIGEQESELVSEEQESESESEKEFEEFELESEAQRPSSLKPRKKTRESCRYPEKSLLPQRPQSSGKTTKATHESYKPSENGGVDNDGMDIGLLSDWEGLPDTFETDSEIGSVDKVQRPLYMEEFDKFAVKRNGKLEGFDDHFRRISVDSEKGSASQIFDEVDRLFLRAADFFRRKKTNAC